MVTRWWRWKLALLSAMLAVSAPAAAQDLVRPQPAESPNPPAGCPAAAAEPSARYTMFTDAKDLAWPISARRALLIGNSRYEDAGTDENDTSLTHLDNLCSPCRDAKAIGNRLAEIGWARNEIAVICDQSAESLRAAFNAALQDVPSNPAHPRFTFIYYAGHGIEVDRHNYLIGTTTRVDWQAKTRSFVDDLRNGQGRLYFEDAEALDLYRRFERFGGAVNSPILILVDACRDNPTKEDVNLAFQKALASGNLQAYRAALQASGVTSGVAEVPDGLEIRYATKMGRSVVDDDGSGHSRLAGALLQELKPNLTIRYVMSQVKRRVRSGNLDPDDAQDVVADGGVLEFATTAPKFAQARPRSLLPPSDFARPRMLRAAYNAEGGTHVDSGDIGGIPVGPTGQASGPGPTKVLPNGRVVWATYEVPSVVEPLTVELFWCSGGDGEAERQHRVQAFAAGLNAWINAGGGRSGSLAIQAVYVTPFTPERNALPNYQRYWDAIYSDPSSIDPDEWALATAIARTGTTLPVRKATSARSAGYVSGFFCRGASELRSTRPSVYVQVATRDDLPSAARVITFLKRRFTQFQIVPRAEALADNPKFPMGRYPDVTDVRYFRGERREDARDIGVALGQASGTPVPDREKPITRLGPSNNIEIWIGRRQPARAWQDIELPSSSTTTG